MVREAAHTLKKSLLWDLLTTVDHKKNCDFILNSRYVILWKSGAYGNFNSYSTYDS